MILKPIKVNLLNVFILVFLSSCSLFLNAQSILDDPCGFTSIHKKNLQNPDYVKLLDEHNLQINKHLSKSVEKGASTITIPIVVHVLHLGEAIGVGSNISDAQILSSITNLNEVYSNTANGGISVDMGVQFVLAKRDPNCNATNGIVRVDASGVTGYSQYGINSDNTNGADDHVLKDLSKWPTDKYMNFWIVTEIDDNNGQSGVQGYANLPVGIDEYNGAVMMSTVFGYDPTGTLFPNTMSYNNDNSTVTHEVGHFLDLYHPFKGGGTGVCPPNETDCSTDGDYVCDTPPIMNYLNYDNNTIYFNCPNGTANACSSGNLDEVMHNIMNYTSCPDRFTAGQRDRVQASIATSRASLTTSLGAIEPSGVFTSPISACNSYTSGLGLTGGYGGIIDVKLNGTINTSSSTSSDNSTNGYMDFTSSCLNVINLEENQTYDLNVSTWYNSHYVKAWIDYNNDGDFDDAGEEITPNGGVVSTSGAEITRSFTIPANASLNTYLRMRIKAEVQNSNFTSCSTLTYGQAEDYTIYIASTCNNSTADAGIDASICSTSTFTASATAAYGTILWTSTGTGTFNDATLEDATYTPSAADISNGSVTLTMTVTNASSCLDATDNLVLNITGIPNSDAGVDATICSTSTYTAAATAGNGVILWTTSGTGSFVDAAVENTVYTPSAADISAGEVTLTITVSSGGCTDAIDNTILTIQSAPSVDAGLDAVICSTSIFNASASSLNGTNLWTTSGDGTFNNSSLEDPIYTPGSNDISTGTVTLTLTVTNGNCSPISDDVLLTINSTPTADIGISSDEICEGENYSLNGISTNGNILWTTSGDGSFNSNSLEDPLYTPGNNDISTNSVLLTMTVSNNGCLDATDNLTLTINSLPSISGGVDYLLCLGDNITLSGSGGESYLWDNGVINGISFSPTTIGTTTYTLVGTDANNCTNSDQVNVTVSGIPTADAGIGLTFCSNDILSTSATASNGSISWTSSGTGSFIDSSVEDATYNPSTLDIDAGTLTLTMTVSNGVCPDATSNVVLTINESPAITLKAFDPICTNTPEITFIGGLPEGGEYKVDNVSETNFDPSIYGTGTYTISYVYTDDNSCSNTATQSLTVGDCAGLSETSLESDVKIFPNPSQGVFKIVTDLIDYSFEVRDINGKIIQRMNNVNNDVEIDLTLNKSGIYYINIIHEDNIVSHQVSIIK